MVTLEKLVKAFDALNVLNETSSELTDESIARKKEKMGLCTTIADSMCSPLIKSAPNFPSLLSFSMTTLLKMCDDNDSNIRMIADESLNRIIRSMMDNNIVKVQVELHKEIKKNGSVRSLRAALWRFAQLADMIRPQKGKPYVQNLIPCLVDISKRREEPVLETLSTALPKIMMALGNFTTDGDIKKLLKSFLMNLSSDVPVVRRTAATSILSICLYCRKPSVFITYALNTIIESIVPVHEDQDRNLVLGALNCVRLLLPHLPTFNEDSDPGLRGSFGVRISSQDTSLGIDRLIQVYELCLHFTHDPDHNMVTSALETLNQLLTSAPPSLIEVLMSEEGLTRSHILPSDSELLSHRSVSEMSLSMPVIPPDESALFDGPEETVQTTRLMQWIHDTPPSNLEMNTLSQNLLPDSNAKTENALLFDDVRPILISSKPIHRAPSLESDILIGRTNETPSPESTRPHIPQSWNIGSATGNGEKALIYCCRRLVTGFLLPETASSIRVRISVRTLALQCVSQVFRIFPEVFVYSIENNQEPTIEGFSHICDILCFSFHPDQQLRGISRLLIGNLIYATIVQSGGSFNDWYKSIKTKNIVKIKTVPLDKLVSYLVSGLEDETSVCIRHTLGSLSMCAHTLLKSKDSHAALPILHKLTEVAKNSYWLVKVKLLELLAELPYIDIHHITGSGEYQTNILYSVISSLLGGDDSRVRKSASECILKMVPHLYFPIDERNEDLLVTSAIWNSRSLLSGLFSETNEPSSRGRCSIEKTLSRVVHFLTKMLFQSPSKSITAGCCQALCLLSQKYSTSDYPGAWQCTLDKVKSGYSASSGLLSSTMALLTAAPIALDLDIQNWLFTLVGNIFYGLAACSLDNAHTKGTTETRQMSGSLHDKKLTSMSKTLMNHILQVLYIFVKVIEESPISTTTTSPIKHIGRHSSPARTHVETEEDKVQEEESSKTSGQAIHLPHYSKLYESLRSAYANYKMVLESNDKSCSLLRSVLETLSKVLEFSTLVESGDIAEEILNYLHTTISLEPTASVNAVQQLLKSLFGANLIAQWEEEKGSMPTQMKTKLSSSDQKQYFGYHGNILQNSYDQLTDYIEENNKQLNDRSKGLKSPLRERKASSILKGLGRNTDRNALASYIRLFEPMVIQALKQYTVTSDVSLQSSVLSLLTQLVQLRVNYCLLDSDQIFIKFVFRQFEFLELGQISNVEMLVAKIFRFLVHLSYEKNHSKPVINVARVIQLCDGLMASGQDPLTYCIPALLPIVEHVFLATIYVDGKQVEAQREVVIAMLLRIAEHHQVLELLSMILREGWRWEDKWRRWSRQSADTILPLLGQCKIRLASPSALSTFLRFLNNLAPGTLRPIDPVLKVFFNVQQSEIEGANTVHSFSAMLVLLVYILCYGKEDGVLSRLEDLNLCIGEEGNDPLNATASNQNDLPQMVLAKLLLKILTNLTTQLNTVMFDSAINGQYNDYLEYLLTHFLLCYVYMFKSGNYTLVAAQFISLIHENNKEPVLKLNKIFYSLKTKSPILTVQWCSFLTLVNYDEADFWSSVMLSKDNSVLSKSNENCNSRNNSKVCLNTGIVRQASIILYCEFFKENLTNLEQFSAFLFDHIGDIVFLSREPHVLDWLAVMNRNPNASGLMMQAISEKCISIERPGFVSQLLNCLGLVHPCISGATLQLISLSLLEHQHLAPARIASSLACRCAEYLLTLSREDAAKQLGKEDLLHIIQKLTRSTQIARKHSGLVSHLHKLASQNFDVPPVAIDQGRSVNTASIPTIVLDRTWFLAQVKLRCCQSESSTRQCAYLLSELDHDDITSVLRCQQFNNGILQYCFLLGTQLSLQARKKEKVRDVDEVLSPLYTAARQSLFQHIQHLRSLLPRTHQVYCPVGRTATCKETIYQERVNQLFADVEFSNAVFRLVPAMTSYFSSLPELSTEKNISELMVPKDSWADLTRFAVLCMEAVHWLLNLQTKPSNWPSLVYSTLKCADSMLKQDQICVALSNTELGSILATLVTILQSCSTNTPSAVFSITTSDSTDTKDADNFFVLHLCHQIAALVTWLEKHNSGLFTVPGFLAHNIKCLVMGIGRCPLVNWHCRTPTEAWTHVSFEQSKPPPPLPTHLLQDIDLLHQIIFRISLFGWTNRQQFEETWVSLLSIINSNPTDVEQDEINAVVQANSIAVQAITTLLVHTTLLPKPGNPNISHLLHVTRDKDVELSSMSWGRKLENISRTIGVKLRDCCRNIKTNVLVSSINEPCNWEKLQCCHRYGYGQISVQFLKTAVMTSEERSIASEACPEFLKHQARLTQSGLDLHSCIQFLLDLYSQWTQIESGISLNLLLEIVRSIVMLSDLFTERSHFTWMVKTCLDLSKIHSQEDDVLQQYLVVAVCKATAVLTIMESDIMDRVIKLLEQSLKSTFTATRVGALHGLMYLFESLSYGNKIVTLIWDSTATKSTLGDPRNRIYQLATDYISKNFDAESLALSNEDHLMTTSVIFNLLEHSPQDLPQDVKSFLMKLTKAASNTQHISIYQMFVQGLNRLVLTNKLPIFRESIIWFALEQLSQADPAVSLPTLQLLVSCIYSAEFGRPEGEPNEIDPEQLVVTMEKTSALFDKIKKGCPLEVECVCAALPCLLADFFPASEVLTKVIGEFLSPQQPHPQLLSAVVFQVLSQACREYQLPLLQAWLVMSLSNFTQALPVAISMWCLTCFFISSSTNPWMRAIFPYIQSRIGRCTNEDRKLLCIAASDFYKQLTDESQKQTFLKTFRDAATSPRSPFADVIASL